jgi:hypothetical protein
LLHVTNADLWDPLSRASSGDCYGDVAGGYKEC